jgi:hypothetical protein
MKKRARIFLFLAILAVLTAALPILWVTRRAHLQQQAAERYLAMVKTDGGLRTYKPPNGSVPDKETAIAIAVAVWQPIYGKEHIERQAPYQANLVDGVWVVSGTLPRGLLLGGTAKALIRPDTGEILQVIHEQ